MKTGIFLPHLAGMWTQYLPITVPGRALTSLETSSAWCQGLEFRSFGLPYSILLLNKSYLTIEISEFCTLQRKTPSVLLRPMITQLESTFSERKQWYFGEYLW